jgi:hypothetical protein
MGNFIDERAPVIGPCPILAVDRDEENPSRLNVLVEASFVPKLRMFAQLARQRAGGASRESARTTAADMTEQQFMLRLATVLLTEGRISPNTARMMLGLIPIDEAAMKIEPNPLDEDRFDPLECDMPMKMKRGEYIALGFAAGAAVIVILWGMSKMFGSVLG